MVMYIGNPPYSKKKSSIRFAAAFKQSQLPTHGGRIPNYFTQTTAAMTMKTLQISVR